MATPEMQVPDVDALPETADLVVVGGGILGCATAFHAATRGLRVVVLEHGRRLGGLTTQAAGGGHRLQFDTPEEVALLKRSLAEWDAFGDVIGEPGIDLRRRRNGYLWVTRDPARAERQRRQVLRQQELGVDGVLWLDGDEARRAFPFLAPEVVGARSRPADGWLDQLVATTAYARAATRRGTTFAFEASVTGFGQANGRVTAVRSTRGTVACDWAIVAAGPFTGAVLRLAGVEVPLAPRVRQRLVLTDAPEVPADAGMTIDEDTGSHWRPEAGGGYVLRPDPDAPVTEASHDPPASRAFYDLLLDPRSPVAVALHAPFWADVWARRTQHWYVTAGQYTYSPDHKPLLGPTAIPNLGINGGYSGHGIMASPAGSRLAIEALLGAVTAAQNPFRYDRQFTHDSGRGPL
jgi:sarcosine oxidase subunit beta